MKFWYTKLPKTFYKNTEKSLNAKKYNKELSSIEDRKVSTNFIAVEEKVFSLGIFRAVATGGQGGPSPPSWFTENTFLQHHVRSRKPAILQKGKITFNPPYT